MLPACPSRTPFASPRPNCPSPAGWNTPAMSSTPETLPGPAAAAPSPSGTPVTSPPTPATPDGSSTTRRRYNTEILLISFSALLLEVSYTRVISFKLFYYYTYLVIGLALLGIGCGGVVVALSDRLRKMSTDTILVWGLILGGASVGAGYLVVAFTPIATLTIWNYGTWDSFLNLGRLLLICLAIFVSFISIGIMIATLFARQTDRIGRLYFADLSARARRVSWSCTSSTARTSARPARSCWRGSSSRYSACASRSRIAGAEPGPASGRRWPCPSGSWWRS